MITRHDRETLRELAKRVNEIASLPIMDERRKMWKRHNRLERIRPMILVAPEGSWRELLPVDSMKCEDKRAREIEWELRRRIYHHEHINDDAPVEKTWKVHKTISKETAWKCSLDTENWGLEPKHHYSSKSNGAFGFDPVLKEPSDLKKLKVPEIVYDEKSTLAEYDEANELFGDILKVQLKGVCYVSFHFMSHYIHLRGLEQMMYDLYDEPEMVHEAMSFFEGGYHKIIDQCLEQNLFSFNNDDTGHSSGGLGYSDELPMEGFNANKARACDLWASAESQEMARVSPEMHEEFVMKYERRLLSRFGLNGYGCCEDLTNKLENVFKFPNIRRISISPWANVDRCAELLQNKYIFSWKPNPAYIATDFDHDFISNYLKHTLDVTKNCVIEMILKDTHTCGNRPERFTMWVNIARKLVEEY